MESLLEPAVVIIALVILLSINNWLFKRLKSNSSGGNLVRNAIAFLIGFIGTLVFILSLPIENSLKGQILTFLGIIISAGIALSSTTLLGNLIAGIMNNSMKRFRQGDLIKIGEIQGRVTQKNIFHTEIQLEDSNFITIPNLYIANNPVKLTRKNNIVISTSVSLGYNVRRDEIEKTLRNAANATGLSDPYVYITRLGDFSVEYKVHGFLEDSGKFFSTNSQLNANVMDKLHEKQIEIVSPTFMNQRRVDDKDFIPRKVKAETPSRNEIAPEDLIFDEVIKSEKIEKKKDFLKEIENKQEQLKEKIKTLKESKDKEEIEKVKLTIQRNEELKIHLEKSIEEQIQKDQRSPGIEEK